jgi:hypothetical protein
MKENRRRDSLFQLVKSLTGAEETAFLNENDKAKDTNYLRLFRELREAESYNEKQLKQSLSINSGNFSVTKAYLAEAINKSLRNFHNGNDPEFHFPKEIHTIRVYLRKELHELAERKLQLLKRYCLKYLLIEQLPEVLSLEYHIAELSRKDTEAIEEERKKLSKQLNDFFALTELNHKLFNLYVKSPALKKNDLIQLLNPLDAQFLSFPLTKLKSHPRVWDVYLGCGIWLSFIKGDMQKAFSLQKQKANLAFHNDYMLDFNVRGLLSIANNVASLAFEAGNKKEHDKAVEEMLIWHEKLKGYSEYKAEHRIYHRLISLQWHFPPKISQDELKVLEEEFLEQHGQFVTLRQLTGIVVFASTYIKLQDPDKAIEWINRFLSHPSYKLNPPLYGHIKLLQLLALLMKREWVSASNAAETLHKFLRKEMGTNHPASVFTRKIRSIKSDNSNRIFCSIYDELSTMADDDITDFARHCLDLKVFICKVLQNDEYRIH